ncbi:MAG: OsmC family protein [Gemmatimonadales bacterium]
MEPEDLVGNVTGEVEKDSGVLVIRRIHVDYQLNVPADVHDTVERVRAVHADSCPVARTLKGCVDITTEVNYVG